MFGQYGWAAIVEMHASLMGAGRCNTYHSPAASGSGTQSRSDIGVK